MVKRIVCIGLCASLVLSPVTVHAAEENMEESVISKVVEWFSWRKNEDDTEKENTSALGRYNSMAISAHILEESWNTGDKEDYEEEKQGVYNCYGETYDEIYGEESRNIYSGYSANGYEFSDREVWILAQVMHHEAGNQCEAGMVAVVEVILNRLFSVYFPDTVAGVVYAPKQFSYVERSKRIIPTDRELELVRDVILGNKAALCDSTITYYRNPDICIDLPACYRHNWGSLEYATYIQDHAFYRDTTKSASDWNRHIEKTYDFDYDINGYPEPEREQEYIEDEVYIEEYPEEDGYFEEAFTEEEYVEDAGNEEYTEEIEDTQEENNESQEFIDE